MTRSLVRLALAACLFAVVLQAQEVAPFALPSSTTGAEAVLLNPAALADLEGLHGYFGLQQLSQDIQWKWGGGHNSHTIKTPFATAWNISDDWALGLASGTAYEGRFKIESISPLRPFFRKFEWEVNEFRASAAYRLNDSVNVGLALRHLDAHYSLAYPQFFAYMPPSGHIGYYLDIDSALSGHKAAWGTEFSALWKTEAFKLGVVLQPEVNFAFDSADYSVVFTPAFLPDPDAEGILSTYFPDGGARTEAVLPLKANVSITFPQWNGWLFSGEVVWVQWSSWKRINIDFVNNTVDPQTGEPVLTDAQFDTTFQDAFSVSGLAVRTIDSAFDVYGRFDWQEKIGSNGFYSPQVPSDGSIITLGGRYPWKFGELALAVDAFYTFGVYSSNNGFEMSRNLLGAGLSVAY